MSRTSQRHFAGRWIETSENEIEFATITGQDGGRGIHRMLPRSIGRPFHVTPSRHTWILSAAEGFGVDEVLYPEEALAFLRTMRHDPDARRGFECLSTSFNWSDEGLPRAMRLCMNHGSRATFYTMVFRTSLIKGEPIEEYRRNWDQLRAACPDWPGFRPERCGTELFPEWRRALKRMCIDFEREMRASEREAAQDAEPG